VAIELIAACATRGLVVGVDPSMSWSGRPQNAIGRRCRTAACNCDKDPVSELPFADSSFTKALALHSIYFWPSVETGLRELYRVLSPDGRLAIGVRIVSTKGGSIEPVPLRPD